MDSICRLCCSTKFVNNNIFDEKTALNLKMALYLPIKVLRNDRLPQKICDKCSCKVNDFYQFYNEAVEVQKRLQKMLGACKHDANETVDLSVVKQVESEVKYCEQSTQTEDIHSDTNDTRQIEIQVKDEPKLFTLDVIKEELPIEQAEDYNDAPNDAHDMPYDIHNDLSNDVQTDNSDDLSLHILKKKKKGKKMEVNGQANNPSGKKRKIRQNDLATVIDSLPKSVSLTQSSEVPLLDKVKEESKHKEQEIEIAVEGLEGLVKREPDMDVFHCCICFTQCYGRSDMLQHYRAHAPAAPPTPPAPPAPPTPPAHTLRCARCAKELAAGEWAAHWRLHWARDSRPYCCSLCEKTFRNPAQILKHGLTHNQLGEESAVAAEPMTKRFVCDICPEAFTYMRSVQAHRARAHPEAALRPLAPRCGTCGRAFAHLNSLRRHLLAHSGERNFLCNVCGKVLSSQEHLKFHIRIHTGYKPNVCKTCGKGFVKKCNLTLHERVHSGEKPHVCSHCGKAFSQRSTLVIHERYHSGARPYVCSLCGRGFVAKGLLSMHLKSTCI